MLQPGKFAPDNVPERAFAVEASEAEPTKTLGEKVRILFDQMHMPVFRFLLRKTRKAAEAEDLTQETFLRLCRHLADDRPLDNPRAWLFTVARNLAVDAGRTDSHMKDLDELTWSQIEESRSGDHPDPETLVVQGQRLDRLHVAVLNLTSLQRQCLHLRAEGLRYREIADMLEISISTVADAVRRATVNLARQLGSETSA